MKKVKFEKEILSKYLDFFNYTLDRIINEISTDKTKSEKKESIKLDLRNGEVEFRILKKISKQFKINVYNFFISEFGVNDFILDFKTKNRNHPLSIDTHYILNYYQNLREDIAYLSETSEKVKRRRVNVNESPKKIAKLYREKFDFNNFLEEEANTADKVFKFLREKIEGEGVYVFKNNKNDKGGRAGLDDNLYGCIFLDRGLPPLILLNSDYPEVSQISTLLHEFAHYLLGEQEIEISENREKTRIEKWCNRFAYHFMISEEIEKGKNFNKQNLKALSEKHFISKMSLMIRFKDLEIVSERELRDFLNRSYKNQDAPAKDKNNKNDKGGVSGNYHTTKKERTSKKFLGVLSENFYSKKISKSEFSKYLGVKYNKVDKYLL